MELKTAGDHIRKVRLEREMSQPQVAALIGVSTDCVTYWETNRAEPQVQHYPKIVRFLGYYPFEEETETLGGTLLMSRRLLGQSASELGKRLGIAGSTVRDWEENRTAPPERMLIAYYELKIE